MSGGTAWVFAAAVLMIVVALGGNAWLTRRLIEAERQRLKDRMSGEIDEGLLNSTLQRMFERERFDEGVAIGTLNEWHNGEFVKRSDERSTPLLHLFRFLSGGWFVAYAMVVTIFTPNTTDSIHLMAWYVLGQLPLIVGLWWEKRKLWRIRTSRWRITSFVSPTSLFFFLKWMEEREGMDMSKTPDPTIRDWNAFFQLMARWGSVEEAMRETTYEALEKKKEVLTPLFVLYRQSVATVSVKSDKKVG